MIHILDDLERYNTWANGKIFSLCLDLSDEQLDQPREMGFGSLRATIFHLLSAEEIWLERWLGVPWRPFEIDPQGLSVDEIHIRLHSATEKRQALVDENRSDAWAKSIDFQDSQQTPYKRQLLGLLLHVSMHGIHHRAQALRYLKTFAKTVVGGIDYLFYRLAQTTLEQDVATIEAMRQYGLPIAETKGDDLEWDRAVIELLYQYHDWATGEVLSMASELSDEQLDKDFGIGPGSIRDTLLHLADAEMWWFETWNRGPTSFPHSKMEGTFVEWASEYRDFGEKRTEYVLGLDEELSQRVVSVNGGGGDTRFRVLESAMQIIGHGVHHRAQLINMLRHSGVTTRNIDLLYSPVCPNL